MALVVRSQWAVKRMALPESLRCCSTHATPANDVSTCSGPLHCHQEKVADRISDQLHQWIGIDSEHEND